MHSSATGARTRTRRIALSNAINATRVSCNLPTFCTTSMSTASRACSNAPLARRASDNRESCYGTSARNQTLDPTLQRSLTSATCAARATKSRRRCSATKTPIAPKSRSNARCAAAASSHHQISCSTAATPPERNR